MAIGDFVDFFKRAATPLAGNQPVPLEFLSDCLLITTTDEQKAKYNRAYRKIMLKLHSDKLQLLFIPLYIPANELKPEEIAKLTLEKKEAFEKRIATLTALQKEICNTFLAAVNDRQPAALELMNKVNRTILGQDCEMERKEEYDFLSMPMEVGISRQYDFYTEIKNEVSHVFCSQLAYLLQKDINLPQMIENMIHETVVVKGAQSGAFILMLLEKKLTDFVIAKGTKLVIKKLLTGIFGCLSDAVAMVDYLKNINTMLKATGGTIQAFISAKPDEVLKQLKVCSPAFVPQGTEKHVKKGIASLQAYYQTIADATVTKASAFVADTLKVRQVVRPLSGFLLKITGVELGGMTGAFFAQRYIDNQIAKPLHNMLTNVLVNHNPQLKCLAIETDARILAMYLRKGVQSIVQKTCLSEEAQTVMVSMLKEQLEACAKNIGFSTKPQSFIFRRVTNVFSGVSQMISGISGMWASSIDPKQQLIDFWANPHSIAENKCLDEQRKIFAVAQACIQDGSIAGDNIFAFLERVHVQHAGTIVLMENKKQQRRCTKILKSLGNLITPLMLAVVSGNIKVVENFLLLEEVDVSANVGGITALHLALLFEYKEIAKILLARRDCAYNMAGGFDRSTPLAIACFKGDLEMVQLILAKDPNLDVNAPLAFGKTLLHCACKGLSANNMDNSFEIIKALLQRGALLGATDSDGHIPLRDCAEVPGIKQAIKKNMGEILVQRLEAELQVLQRDPRKIINEFRAILEICHQLELSAPLLKSEEHQKTIGIALTYELEKQTFVYANYLLQYGISCPQLSIAQLKAFLPGMIEYTEGSLPLLTAVLNQCPQDNLELRTQISGLFQQKLFKILSAATWLNCLPFATDYGQVAGFLLRQYDAFFCTEDVNKISEIALKRGYSSVVQQCLPRATNVFAMLELMNKEGAAISWDKEGGYAVTKHALCQALPIGKPTILLLAEDSEEFKQAKALAEKQRKERQLKALIGNLVYREEEKNLHEQRVLDFLRLPQGREYLNMRTEEGNSIYLYAIQTKRYTLVLQLLELGIDLDLPNYYTASCEMLRGLTSSSDLYPKLEYRLEAFRLSKVEISGPEVVLEQKMSAELLGIKAMLAPCIEMDVNSFQETVRLILNAPNATKCLQAPVFEGDSLFQHLIKMNKYEHADALLTLSESLPIEKRVDINAIDKEGKTPLMLCLEHLHSYMVGQNPPASEIQLTQALLVSVDLSIQEQRQQLQALLEAEQGRWTRNSALVAPVFQKLEKLLTVPGVFLSGSLSVTSNAVPAPVEPLVEPAPGAIQEPPSIESLDVARVHV